MLASELPAYFPGLIGPLLQRIGGGLDRRLPKLADHVCAVNSDIRNRLVQEHGFDPARVSVVANGVETERFIGLAPGSGTAGRLIYAGTLAPYQGVELLLQAFALALRTHPWLRLCLSVTRRPSLLCASRANSGWWTRSRSWMTTSISSRRGSPARRSPCCRAYTATAYPRSS